MEEPLVAVVRMKFEHGEFDPAGAHERQRREVVAGGGEAGAFEHHDRVALRGEPEVADDSGFLELPDGGRFLTEQVGEVGAGQGGEFAFEGEERMG